MRQMIDAIRSTSSKFNAAALGRRIGCAVAVLIASQCVCAAWAAEATRLTIKFRGGGDRDVVTLNHRDDRQQLVVMTTDVTGRSNDLTREVTFTSAPPIVEIDSRGFVRPLENGDAVITARSSDREASINVIVSSLEQHKSVSFPNDVLPLLTRAGCNGGACHGTPSGKNSFRLSLLGFEPKSDHEYLTKESRGRRVSPAVPELSLFLRKACGDLPHGGGVRIERNDLAYETLRRWIQEGMPYGPSDEPFVERIEIFPNNQVVNRGASQQIAVTAYFSDGQTRDITRVARYKANQPSICEVDDRGLVQFNERMGTTSIMVRYQDQVGAFMATIPLGMPTPNLPHPSNFIDERVFSKLKVLGLPASEVCDDATFLRRVTLDLNGRLPTADEAREFVASTSKDKRSKKIDQLLESPSYADLFANKWSGILRNKAGGNLEQVARETFGFHAWIRTSLNENRPFSRIATELITARGKPNTNPAVSWYRAVQDPKDQMADIAQVFLGVRIQCAQCHHHPYEKWSQDDYYGFAAFFSTIGRKEIRKMPEDDILYHKRTLAVSTNPVTNKELRPTPLGAKPIDIPAHRDPRVQLAEWACSPENPYFSRVLVNRYWKHFFGRAFVEPEDDMRVTNPATHPELLNELAASFVESNFDLKQLCRDICNSRAYQLSSFPNEHNEDDEQNFARFYPRRLPAEVMLDAINSVAGAENNFNHQPVGIRTVALPDDSSNRESFFLRVFGRPQMDTACECERTAEANLGQSLHLINSDAMHKILSAPNGRANLWAREKQADDRQQISDVYLHALSREPNANEMETALAHIARKRKRASSEGADPKSSPSYDKANREAYEDIIWVVVNTKEFLFNH